MSGKRFIQTVISCNRYNRHYMKRMFAKILINDLSLFIETEIN